MPLYEYECAACGHRFERIQKFSDPPIETCPTCGGSVRKLLSSPAIQFKGTGWYITDYARKDSGASSGSSASGEKKAEKTEKKDDGGSGSGGSSSPASGASGSGSSSS